ncbi:MAG: hypothetical protein ACREDE_09890, partial [Thermoplasmata archaeon]
LETIVLREPGEHPLPRGIAIPVPKPMGRPRIEYRFRVRSAEDAEVLRHRKLPVHSVTAERITELGYPIRFPTVLVAAGTMIPLIETHLRTIPFVSEDAARSPRDEDAIVAMLRIDMLGARAIWERNPGKLNATYLLGRLLQERLERRANLVRFFDVLPSLPRVGPAIGSAELNEKLSKNLAGTGF